MKTDEKQVLKALRHVREPELDRDLVTLGMVRDLRSMEPVPVLPEPGLGARRGRGRPPHTSRQGQVFMT